MSETPKKIEFMMMNDSAAELVIASSVAFIDSDDNCDQSRRQTRELAYITHHKGQSLEL